VAAARVLIPLLAPEFGGKQFAFPPLVPLAKLVRDDLLYAEIGGRFDSRWFFPGFLCRLDDAVVGLYYTHICIHLNDNKEQAQREQNQAFHITNNLRAKQSP
jgi:hypothetical protein